MTRSQKTVFLVLAALVGVGEGYMIYHLYGGMSPPCLELDTTEVDFGTLPAELQITREVRIANRGGSRLVISKVQTGCGCSDVAISPNVVEPGESASLRISLTGDGQIAKAVTVYIFSNDPEQPVCKVLAKANSIADCLVEPKSVDFGRIERRSQLPSARSFKLLLGRQQDVALNFADLKVTSRDPYIGVDDSAPATGNTKEIRVSLLEGAPAGDIYSQLQIRDATNGISIKLDVRGYVCGAYVALPQMIVLGPVLPDSQPLQESIVLKRRALADRGGGPKGGLFDIESIAFSESLKPMVCVKHARTGEEVILSVVAMPRTYPGPWSGRDMIGHIRVVCTDSGGGRETVNIPALVSVRMPKLRDQ